MFEASSGFLIKVCKTIRKIFLRGLLNQFNGKYFKARKAERPSHRLRCSDCACWKSFQSSEVLSNKNWYSSQSHTGGPISQPPNITACGHPLKCERTVYNAPITQIAGVIIDRSFSFVQLDCLLISFICLIDKTF